MSGKNVGQDNNGGHQGPYSHNENNGIFYQDGRIQFKKRILDGPYHNFTGKQAGCISIFHNLNP